MPWRHLEFKLSVVKMLNFNQPFKASPHEPYDHWMAGDADKEYTDRRNMRAPAQRILVAWVLKVSNKLVKWVKNSNFKMCVCVSPSESLHESSMSE